METSIGGINAALDVHETINELLATMVDARAAREVRVDAGTRLARLGDPRPGVLTLEPSWCLVPAGWFVMGSENDPAAFQRERPQHRVHLQAFRVARYPVTIGQWQRFVADNGYGDRAWWSDAGWVARKTGNWVAPRSWSKAGWVGNAPNRPAVSVSCHEAEAFCAWLSAKLDYTVRLCSESEWEKAARGTDGRIYPAGDDLDSEAYHLFCKGALQEEDAPAPVGCYPQGASPYGAEDMSGNTYAWTSSRWGPSEAQPAFSYPYDPGDGREARAGDGFRVVRGGAWCFPSQNARCAYRGKDSPDEAFRSVGLRLVCAGFG